MTSFNLFVLVLMVVVAFLGYLCVKDIKEEVAGKEKTEEEIKNEKTDKYIDDIDVL